MKDLFDILQVVEKLDDDSGATIATLTHAKGSSYRTPGARVLIQSDGTMVGVLSGGCLEADLYERSKAVAASQQPALVTYDTSSLQEIVDGLGIGCDGKIQIFLEPVRPARPLFQFIQHRFDLQRPGVVATVYHVRGFPDVSWGTRCMIDEDGIISNTISDKRLADEIISVGADVLKKGETRSLSVEIGAEAADILFEYIRPPQQLCIFGAGPGSQALARLAKAIGWHVSVFDHKEKASHKTDYEVVDRLVVGDFAEMGSHIPRSSQIAAVVMSHNFDADLEYMKLLLASPVQYVGLLGSRNRRDQLIAGLKDAGMSLDAEITARIHNPVGLDTGAEGPEEIAISILAEIRSVLSGRSGGFLRDRKGPIHEDRS